MSNEQVRKVIPYKPGKRPDTFRRLDLGNTGTALEEALAEQQTQIDRPPSPVITSPVTDPVTTPATRPVTDSVTNPVASPVTYPVAEPATDRRPFVYLDSTHTGSEQRVYSVMHRETINKGNPRSHFSVRELMDMTGIRSDKTIRTAVKGLIQKLSIVQLQNLAGDPAGSYFEVRGPKDILNERRRTGLQIESKNKRVITAPVTGPVTDPITSPVTRQETESVTAVENTKAPPVIFTEHEYNTKNNLPVAESSSGSNAIDDDEKLAKVRKWFKELSPGAEWKPERDDPQYAKVAHIPEWHILIAMCGCQDKCPEHRISSFAYFVNEILAQSEKMSEFPESFLIEQAFRYKTKILLAIQTGKWTVE